MTVDVILQAAVTFKRHSTAVFISREFLQTRINFIFRHILSSKTSKTTFLLTLPYFRENLFFFFKVTRLLLFDLLVRATCRWIWRWSVVVMTLTGKNRSTLGIATLSATNLKRTDLGSNLCLRGEKPATNREPFFIWHCIIDDKTFPPYQSVPHSKCGPI